MNNLSRLVGKAELPPYFSYKATTLFDPELSKLVMGTVPLVLGKWTEALNHFLRFVGEDPTASPTMCRSTWQPTSGCGGIISPLPAVTAHTASKWCEQLGIKISDEWNLLFKGDSILAGGSIIFLREWLYPKLSKYGRVPEELPYGGSAQQHHIFCRSFSATMPPVAMVLLLCGVGKFIGEFSLPTLPLLVIRCQERGSRDNNRIVVIVERDELCSPDSMKIYVTEVSNLLGSPKRPPTKFEKSCLTIPMIVHEVVPRNN